MCGSKIPTRVRVAHNADPYHRPLARSTKNQESNIMSATLAIAVLLATVFQSRSNQKEGKP
jgi:hypothetical protein